MPGETETTLKEKKWGTYSKPYTPSVSEESTGRSAAIQQNITDKFEKKVQEKKDRKKYAEDIVNRAQSGGVNSIAREDFIDQRHLFPESFQDSNVYAKYMQDLHQINPPAMQQAFPWASGKGLADLVTMATPLKYLGMAKDWGQEKLGQGYDLATEGLGDIYENLTDTGVGEAAVGGTKDVWEDLKGLKNMPGEFLNLLPGISGHAQGGIVETMPDYFHDYSRGI